MKPYIHAKNSAKKWGGKPEDYLPIHDTMDSSKCAEASVKHRAVFHSAFGIFIIEKIFGTNIVNSEAKEVSVRDIAEQHVLEDMGTIPSLSDWLKDLPTQEWMSRPISCKKSGNLFNKKDKKSLQETLNDLLNNKENIVDEFERQQRANPLRDPFQIPRFPRPGDIRD